MSARLRILAMVGPLAFLASCASSPPPEAQNSTPADRDVIGAMAGTPDDRTVIRSSNQQIFDAEHAQAPDPSASPSAQSQGIP
jgi:hypothetical protein